MQSQPPKKSIYRAEAAHGDLCAFGLAVAIMIAKAISVREKMPLVL